MLQQRLHLRRVRQLLPHRLPHVRERSSSGRPRPVENKFVTPGTKKPETDTKKPETDTKKPETDPKKPETDPKKTGNNGAANLKFRLPADAKLYVDGRLTNGDGSERTSSPRRCRSGQQYYYEVKAELMVNGEMVTEEKRMVVAADEVIETFPKLTAAARRPARWPGSELSGIAKPGTGWGLSRPVFYSHTGTFDHGCFRARFACPTGCPSRA